jgi:hypothetical protein
MASFAAFASSGLSGIGRDEVVDLLGQRLALVSSCSSTVGAAPMIGQTRRPPTMPMARSGSTAGEERVDREGAAGEPGPRGAREDADGQDRQQHRKRNQQCVTWCAPFGRGTCRDVRCR